MLALFEEYLATVPWAIYDVRRTFSPRSDGRFNHARTVKILDTGSRETMHAQLRACAQAARLEVTVGDHRFPDDQHSRAWRRRRRPDKSLLISDAEHFLTVAPATAVNKTGPAFPRAWAKTGSRRGAGSPRRRSPALDHQPPPEGPAPFSMNRRRAQ
ncbi:hypothetical protein AB0I53_23565 [Saccharopolyspora sp. NPDC050389]|uniref:hypothetical protein n=1 Tax=Saccharopolyspora sp. NPDC050389 TaxID=3155516 RepID=UPI00340CBD96